MAYLFDLRRRSAWKLAPPYRGRARLRSTPGRLYGVKLFALEIVRRFGLGRQDWYRPPEHQVSAINGARRAKVKAAASYGVTIVHRQFAQY
jgi:hypothetical protein